jgi:hypothetical protein
MSPYCFYLFDIVFLSILATSFELNSYYSNIYNLNAAIWKGQRRSFPGISAHITFPESYRVHRNQQQQMQHENIGIDDKAKKYRLAHSFTILPREQHHANQRKQISLPE